jgi:two-component system, chemotaxis family, response regulator Rcp1
MTHSLHVLLIEDNPADVALMKRALHASPAHPQLSIVPDGIEAMRFLRRQTPYHDVNPPHLILLDLNLPRKGGMEVLAEVKADPSLKIIPVIVLTSSGSAVDIVTSYALGANSYLRKAVTLEGVTDMFNTMEHFWMNLASLPTNPEAAH